MKSKEILDFRERERERVIMEEKKYDVVIVFFSKWNEV